MFSRTIGNASKGLTVGMRRAVRQRHFSEISAAARNDCWCGNLSKVATGGTAAMDYLSTHKNSRRNKLQFQGIVGDLCLGVAIAA
jgi:hypothetical protein